MDNTEQVDNEFNCVIVRDTSGVEIGRSHRIHFMPKPGHSVIYVVPVTEYYIGLLGSELRVEITLVED